MSKAQSKLKTAVTKSMRRSRARKKQFVTRAEARRAERHVLNRVFKGAPVKDGEVARLCIYNQGKWTGKDVWVVYKNFEQPNSDQLALKSSEVGWYPSVQAGCFTKALRGMRDEGIVAARQSKAEADKKVRELAKGSQAAALTAGQARDALNAFEPLQNFFSNTERKFFLFAAVSEFASASEKLNGGTSAFRCRMTFGNSRFDFQSQPCLGRNLCGVQGRNGALSRT